MSDPHGHGAAQQKIDRRQDHQPHIPLVSEGLSERLHYRKERCKMEGKAEVNENIASKGPGPSEASAALTSGRERMELEGTNKLANDKEHKCESGTGCNQPLGRHCQLQNKRGGD